MDNRPKGHIDSSPNRGYSLRAMNCPKCDATELTTLSMPGAGAALEIDQCPDCMGVWFDPDELGKYAGAAIKLVLPKVTAKSDAELDERAGACPRCALPLARQPGRRNPTLMMDVCGKCGGTWIDGAELAQAGSDGASFSSRMIEFLGEKKGG